jgi:hypothetical protein
MNRLLCLCLLLLSGFAVNAQEFTATIDRSRLSLGESVELSLESSDTTRFDKPDLSPLNELFEVQSTRQVNRLSTLEGKTHATTRWIVTLQPRQSGYLVVPPLQLGNLHSQPISLHVRQANASTAEEQLEPVFINASLDQDNIYVQAQTVLTLRIYHSVSLYDDSRLSALEMADARIEPLGEPHTYEQNIGGVRHGVIELRYAIFPQKSGPLLIPGQVFSATLVDRSNSAGFTPFGPRPGRVARVQSPDIPLTVKPRPDEYPADAPWLPARALSLTEKWQPKTARIKSGDALTRTIQLKADGLSSAQLPALPSAQVEGLRRYPDQPQLNNQTSEQGLIGSREEREALIASQPGTLELPPVELVWWNTLEDHLERTTLPSHSLEVLAAAPQPLEASALPQASVATQPDEQLWRWQLSSLLLTLTTLLGFTLWWRARRQPAVQRNAQAGPSPRTLLDDLKRACQANDSQATRQALDAWARQQPETLAAMAARFAPLSEALDSLNGALYSENGQHWQGSPLWHAIGTLPTAEKAHEETPESSPLAPLYPR